MERMDRNNEGDARHKINKIVGETRQKKGRHPTRYLPAYYIFESLDYAGAATSHKDSPGLPGSQ